MRPVEFACRCRLRGPYLRLCAVHAGRLRELVARSGRTASPWGQWRLTSAKLAATLPR